MIIKKIYIYLVLFATLMMTIGGSVGVFMALADIIVPHPSYHRSFEDFREMRVERQYYMEEGTEKEEVSAEELRERYDAMVAEQKEAQSMRAKNNLIKSLGWILIPFPVFLIFHRNLAKDN